MTIAPLLKVGRVYELIMPVNEDRTDHFTFQIQKIDHKFSEFGAYRYTTAYPSPDPLESVFDRVLFLFQFGDVFDIGSGLAGQIVRELSQEDAETFVRSMLNYTHNLPPLRNSYV